MSANKIALVTGGTDGIGKQVALRLAQAGAQVVIIGRNRQKGEQAIAEIGANATYHQADLSKMREVDALADVIQSTYPKLDWLIHSAGVMLPRKTMTDEGLEMVFAVQYFARYRLNMRLMPHLQADARVINISAGGTIPLRLHIDNLNSEKLYHGVYTLTHESVANDVMTLRFMRVYPHIAFYGYGPFYVKSNLFTDMGWMFKLTTNTIGRLMASTPQRAADDVMRLATGNYEAGLYARNCKRVKPNKHRRDEVLQEALYTATEGYIQRALSS
ncbi:MAG: hypothetical protein CUN52_02345 [Phototrophicales bacterium]|jgi:NAD(P)-dependent dehydrogenase (short-subunit alcohol dehydrogenase family)|nr:MAG: hypothetical protein CUN52_02345 [Phototrophicales bacterium]